MKDEKRRSALLAIYAMLGTAIGLAFDYGESVERVQAVCKEISESVERLKSDPAKLAIAEESQKTMAKAMGLES